MNEDSRRSADEVIERLIQLRLSDQSFSLPGDDTSQTLYPVLWQFLTRRDVNGTLAKTPASISIRLGLGDWLVTLSDPSLEVSLTVNVAVLSEALQCLEKAVSSTRAAWQPWKGSEGKFTKRNKKPLSGESIGGNAT